LPDGSSSKFGIDETTGVVKVVEPLTAETTYELTVLASDHGTPQPLESTAFLTIHVENVAKASATGVNVVWLTDDGLPSLWENLTLGYVVARASVETINGGK
jgi:DhnA family fructose-bisphosphate aldolase class Ia